MIWGLLAAALVALLAYTAWGIWRFRHPTRGAQIERAERPGKALLVIDMQETFTELSGTGDWGDAELDAAFDEIAARARAFQDEGAPVIVVRQVTRDPFAKFLNRLGNAGRGNADAPGIGLDPRLQIDPDADIEKPMADAFAARALDPLLAEHRVGTLHLAGLDGAYCVQATAHGALNRGYHVVVEEPTVLSARSDAWTAARTKLAARGARIRDGSPQPRSSVGWR